ncbi:right-handed parallel beta-helix repeat-containing protein [Stieleria sp. JC731]|uniref:right-handed parallel beta-helix repeat-containing protein n=1 Tax=Pirellulaceae TaxID=2691357 RepID=UPI001E28B197|nr:right-handed parallel beta-helix repeat-containing protein [Stieleria sp. JC731]MCC9600916.1 right-handed parallel beta-helix repeat-containing protein [Stieleria sp. JC731]
MNRFHFIPSVMCAAFLLALFAQVSSSNDCCAATVEDLAGDGQTDDSAAIQALIDESQGSVRFRKGVYRLTRTVVIDLAKVGWTSLSGDGVAQFRMEGPGPAFKVIGNHGGTASPATVDQAIWDRERSPMIDAIEIVGAHSEACGIEAQGTMQLTLTRVVVRKAKDAIRLVKRNRNTILSECHLYENRGVGVFLDGVNLHQINIANCHISYNAGGGVVAKRSEIRNLQITGCDIEGNFVADKVNGETNTEPTANVWLDSSESSIGEVAIVGCTIQHAHEVPGSANIRINGFSEVRKFTDERRTGNITIANNILSDVQTNVHLVDVRGVTITGNTMWKGYSTNVIAKGCDQLVFTGNLYDRNPRYHYGDGASAKLGVLIEDCSNVTATAEHFGGETDHMADLQVRRCDGVNIVGCTFAAVSKFGIALDSVQFAQITGCLFTGMNEDAKQIQSLGDSDFEYRNNRFRVKSLRSE